MSPVAEHLYLYCENILISREISPGLSGKINDGAFERCAMFAFDLIRENAGVNVITLKARYGAVCKVWIYFNNFRYGNR